MMSGLDDWLAVARAAEADDLRDRILTGFKSGKPFTPYVATIPLPVPARRILDFGCGVGRNFPWLRTIGRHVTGFDLPPMIERCRSLAGDRIDALSDDWNEVREQSFDLIVATLVFQHIEPASCAAYLVDCARMAPAFYLLTRADSDFSTNVLETVAQTHLFRAGACVEVEHDPATHQLRMLGARSFDDLRTAAGGHYEVLLESMGGRKSCEL